MKTIDKLYVAVANRKPFFTQGWGDPELLRHLLDTPARQINRVPEVPEIQIQWVPVQNVANPVAEARADQAPPALSDLATHSEWIGRFASPFRYSWSQQTSELPEPVREASFQLILPSALAAAEWPPPLVLHFAATGDEGFARRRIALAEPLRKLGIASLILENPYYGARRMPGRNTSNSATVQELLQMSRAAQDESVALLRTMRELGFRRLGTTGVSMGGYMALSLASRFPEPLAVAACIPSHSAAPVYTEGILSRCCDWATLERTNPFPERGSARELLNEILSVSDLRHLARPRKIAGCVIVGGQRDAYIPRYSTMITHYLRPDAELRWIDMGHVTSFVLGRGTFVQAILDSLRREPGSSSASAR